MQMQPPPLVPPGMPIPQRNRPVWPTVIGIISICLGGLTVLCGLIGMMTSMVSQSLLKSFSSFHFPTTFPSPTSWPASMPASGPMSMPASRPTTMPVDISKMLESFTLPPDMRKMQLMLQVAGLALAVGLLVAGILLVRRRRLAISLHLVYAVLASAAAILSTMFTYWMVGYVQKCFIDSISVAEKDTFMRSMMQAPFGFQRYASVISGLVFGLAYPVFLLIWFLRPKPWRDLPGTGSSEIRVPSSE